MGHTPHIYVPGPWDGATFVVSDKTRHHLERVLRRSESDVSYTDGLGRVGAGIYGAGRIQRGEEDLLPRPTPQVTMAVAVPANSGRARFVVEKLAELGIDRLLWLETAWSQGRPPRDDRAAAWATAALEQSRGAWRLELGGRVDLAELPSLDGAVMVAEPGGDPLGEMVRSHLDREVIVAVGPEGGFAPDEIPDSLLVGSLGGRILRTDTAAVVAAGLITTARDHRGAARPD